MMAPNRGRNRQQDFEDLAPSAAAEFDPEEDTVVPDDSDEASEDGNEFDGREHYEDVGKSKLRKPKDVALGPQYRGSKVGRQEIESEDEDEDDPFGRGFEEGSSDGDEAESDDEDDGDEEGTDDTDLSEDGDEDVEMSGTAREEDKDLMEQVKKLRDAESQRSVAKSLSAANQEEAEKGRAVKRQRTTFDSLLNTRMKLQKSLIATNTLVGTPAEEIDEQRTEAQQALDSAEQAAFNLWNSLNTFREDLIASRTGKKRKRSSFSVQTSTEDLWDHIQSQESESKSNRDTVLKKWSTKSQGPSVQSHTGRLNQSAPQTTIIDVLQEQLSNTDRLLKKAHAPRSCAPLQASQRISEDPKIYDDADFYGLLLKELLEQKSADSVAASNIDLGFQMRREAKTKRNVDTKASKGRKLRYTVHEKLLNFMAAEDRTRWGDRQADELFGSLFGQQLGLGEKEEVLDEMEAGVDGDEAGLLMFG